MANKKSEPENSEKFFFVEVYAYTEKVAQGYIDENGFIALNLPFRVNYLKCNVFINGIFYGGVFFEREEITTIEVP